MDRRRVNDIAYGVARWGANGLTVLFFLAMAGVVAMTAFAVVWMLWDVVFG